MDESEAKRQKTEVNGGLQHVHDSNGVNHFTMPNLYHHLYTVSPNELELANAVKISPNKETFAVCTSKGLIRVYDLKSGYHISTLLGHTKGVSDIAYSPIDSNIIALCSDDLTIRIWSISKSKCLRILKKHTFHITTITFNSKGNLLISGAADETIVIWDLTTGRSLKTLAAHSDPVSSVGLTPDDTIIISGSYDGLMRLFDLGSGQCLKTLVYNSSTHGTATASTNDVVNFPISHIQVSPNGKYILSSSLDGKIRLWDYMNNKVVKTYGGINGDIVNNKYDSGCCFITVTENSLVASGSDHAGVLFWDIQSKEVVFQLQPGDTVLDIAMLENGEKLITSTLLGKVNVYELNGEYEKLEGSHLEKLTLPHRERHLGTQTPDTPMESHVEQLREASPNRTPMATTPGTTTPRTAELTETEMPESGELRENIDTPPAGLESP